MTDQPDMEDVARAMEWGVDTPNGDVWDEDCDVVAVRINDDWALGAEGWKAIMLRLLDRGVTIDQWGLRFDRGVNWAAQKKREAAGKPDVVLTYATPGHPTDEELMRALVDVCG